MHARVGAKRERENDSRWKAWVQKNNLGGAFIIVLIDMRRASRDGIRDKSLHQLLAFAGEGKLRDFFRRLKPCVSLCGGGLWPLRT